ncbi:MAG: T9SS type A sorting domain-containing protein, partial [Bacteroidia bacterium]|nr:T9SS type A sorting domain-containing protein [Bacteroidia bacterium]
VGLRFDPDTIYTVPSNMVSSEAVTVHSDQDGNLLLYSNGEKIWNANHEVIHNGNLILGNMSSNLGSVFVFHEDNPDYIYLFNTNWATSTNKELSFNLIVREADTFRVVFKDSVLQTNICEAIAVVKADNGRDIWIVTHVFNGSNFVAYRLTQEGLIPCPVTSASKSYIGGNNSAAVFPMTFSSNGKYLIKSNTLVPIPIKTIELYQFDNKKGMFDFLYSLDSLKGLVHGINFSKSYNNIYAIERDYFVNTFSFNPNDSDYTANSKKQFQIKGYSYLGMFKYEIQNLPYTEQLALSILDSTHLAIFNENADSINVIDKGIFLGGNNSAAGLPNFNQSYYYTPSINFTMKLNCVSNAIQFHGQDTFSATSHDWLITKQGATPITDNIKNPLIEFTDTGIYEVRYIASNGSRSDTITKTIDILPKINPNFLGSDTGWCENSNASVTLHAPSGMHCYQWSNGSTSTSITADTAGVYIAKITTPNFCVLYDTLIISIDTLPHTEADFLGDNLHWCENSDSSVILKAPDGFASYQWSTGDTTQEIEADTAGKYWVRAATVNGCFIADTLVISLDTLPDIATGFLGNNISWCENIDTSVILKAPADMLLYEWNTGSASPQIQTDSASVYWVTVTAHNLCVFSDTVTVSIDTLPDIAPDFLGDNINWCENLDTSVMLIAPADMLSYLWNTNETTQEIEVSNAGTYWVKITAHNLCVLRDTVIISLDTVPNVPIIYKENDTLKTNVVADYYQWYRYELPIGSNQDYLLVSDTGVYRLMITNAFGCFAFSDTLHIPAPKDTSNDNVNAITFKNIKLYPNPASTELTFEIAESGNYVYEIIGIAGNLIMKVQLQAGVNTIDISRINAGIYLVHVFDGKRWIMHAKLSICKE